MPTTANLPVPVRRGYLADIYTFDWKQLSFRTPLIGILSIGLCLFGGVLFGHPSAGLIAGGGAFTIGFGVNQRIADSRLWPMIAATAAVFLSTMIGMLVGHRGFTLVLAAAIWGFTYGILTARAAGISWVGQQSAITLFVASAFPANFHFTLLRSLLIGGGGALQILITSICLRLLPELAANLRAIRQTSSEELSHLFSSNFARYRMLLRLRALPENLLHIPTFPFAIRMSLTVAISAEVYRHLGVQSGYWIPMTALLVQKPAFSETFSRAFLRVGGTLAGAVLSTIFLIHIRPDPYYLAALTTFFALWSYATNTVNYGLYTLFLTSYIVFLLSLNSLPGPVIAHRRALCTIAGGLIALVIHVDAIRRLRNRQRTLPAQLPSQI
ncbi:MAG TPA: FUSC family protein [Edaphobacter sp.]|uniref:FUSC family protein n=1 Tax=Edaphobacter sp. TaxID=1934404 RepID=UPI002CB97120|nr:FUSC family protein [Edaphobacter sp.]HUZ93661.1 FUSC family protein [Edaphobacter sp.]